MSGKTDVVKGRIKEAAGALTGNDKLRDEGKTEQVVGKTEQDALIAYLQGLGILIKARN